MLDNLEQLQIQLAQLQGELDGHEAARQLERDRLLKEFPKRDMLKEEAKRINGGWLPYDSKRNWNVKDDLVSWLIERNVPEPKETFAQYHEARQRISAVKVNMTFPQWETIYGLSLSNYEVRKFWTQVFPEQNLSIYTDGGLHYFSVIRIAINIAFDVIYLEGRTPAAKDSVVYLGVLPDGQTYLVDSVRYKDKKYDIGKIRYGELREI